jgi:3-deoxy-D-manno-octulosonic-acid transferase
MTFAYLAYRSALGALRLAGPAVAHGGSKLARGLRGRRHAGERLRTWARAYRDPARPLLWMHAPSVGEGLQAAAILIAVKSLDPSVQTVFTHFSPSAEALAQRIGVDVADYLPWDLVGEIGPVLDALSPTLVAFTKTEVWPTFAAEAERRGIPLALVAATLPASSSRLSRVAGPLLRPAFGRLNAVHAVSDDDGSRFAKLSVPRERVTVTGDPGVDSAAQRIAAADPEALHLRVFRNPRPRVVAGSTWPVDHLILISAAGRARAEVPELQMVIAPHEPGELAVTGLVIALRAAGWRAGTLGEAERAGSSEALDAVVVERVGVLAHLYTIGAIAYVGGGFHNQGLHSVLEPAAAGIPCCFGPRHQGSLAAGELLRAGAASAADGEGSLAQVISRWLTNGEARGAAGRAAAEYVRAHRGAAERTAKLLLQAMTSRGKN